jgi:hypothetical protein
MQESWDGEKDLKLKEVNNNGGELERGRKKKQPKLEEEEDFYMEVGNLPVRVGS